MSRQPQAGPQVCPGALPPGSPGLQGVEVVIEGQPNGGLVLLPPPGLQLAGEPRLTLVQAVHALLQQLEALLHHIKGKRPQHGGEAGGSRGSTAYSLTHSLSCILTRWLTLTLSLFNSLTHSLTRLTSLSLSLSLLCSFTHSLTEDIAFRLYSSCWM